MSSLNGKELSYAVAHGTIKVPSSAQIGPALSSTSDPMLKSVKMTVQDGLVRIEAPSSVRGKTTPEIIYVPLTNFSHFTVKEDKTVATDNKA